MKHNGIEKRPALEIFGILEKFAQYGFNKSHSAAYAMLSYRTAYLKANYPVEFMAAVLSNELGNADKVAHYIDECASMKIAVSGPEINISRDKFTPDIDPKTGHGSIRFGLAAIKGVGDAASQTIIVERGAGGPFDDFHSFIDRVDSKAVNRRVVECLIKSGAFDAFGEGRQYLLQGLDVAISVAAQRQRDRERGQESFLDMLGDTVTLSGNGKNMGRSESDNGGNFPKMPLVEKLQFEKDLLGFYISGHPMREFEELARDITSFDADRVNELPDRENFRFCGVISNVSKKLSRRDDRPWAIFNISTESHNLRMNMYADAFESYGDILKEGKTLVASGTVINREAEDLRFNVREVSPLSGAIPNLIREVRWVLQANEEAVGFLETLRRDLDSRQGGSTRLIIGFLIAENQVLWGDISPALTWLIEPRTFAELKSHPSVVSVSTSTAPMAPEAWDSIRN